ncbi:MAG: hypothetical protein ACI4LX_01465 [Treponema sp.]
MATLTSAAKWELLLLLLIQIYFQKNELSTFFLLIQEEEYSKDVLKNADEKNRLGT